MKGPVPVMQVKIRPGSISAGIVNVGPRVASGDVARGEVESFTDSSRRRLLSWLACAKPSYRIMVTLTVPHIETDGAIFKNRLDRFLVAVMRNAPAGGSVTWFLEFQKRGAPHVHMLTNFKIKKEWVAETWSRLWEKRISDLFGQGYKEGMLANMRHASTRVEWLRSASVMKKYASKYSAKTNQKEVPEDYTHVGRFWGIRGDRTRVAAATYRRRCFGAFGTFPGDVIRLFWIRFNRLLCDKQRYRVFKWQQGTGVTAYFSEDSTASVTSALELLLADFDFELVVTDDMQEEAEQDAPTCVQAA